MLREPDTRISTALQPYNKQGLEPHPMDEHTSRVSPKEATAASDMAPFMEQNGGNCAPGQANALV